MLHEVAHLLGVALGAKPGVELSYQLIYVVSDVVNFGAQLPKLLRWAGFQLCSFNQPPQVSGLAEPADFGILPELLRLLPVQAQADFIVLRFGSSFLPPVDGIGVRVLPASGAKDIFARCLRTLAAGERELRRWAQVNVMVLVDKMLLFGLLSVKNDCVWNTQCPRNPGQFYTHSTRIGALYCVQGTQWIDRHSACRLRINASAAESSCWFFVAAGRFSTAEISM